MSGNFMIDFIPRTFCYKSAYQKFINTNNLAHTVCQNMNEKQYMLLRKMLSFPSKKGNILCRLPILPNSAGIMEGVLERPGGLLSRINRTSMST